MLGLLAAIVISITPQVCLAPCDIKVTARIEANPANNLLQMELEGPRYSQVSEIPLGENHRKTVEIWYRRVLGGNYVITARLIRHDGKSWVAGVDKKNVRVTDPGNE